MLKLTDRQLATFQMFIVEQRKKGHCNDSYFKSGERLTNKLLKLGLIDDTVITDGHECFKWDGDDNRYKCVVTQAGIELLEDDTLAMVAQAYLCPKCNGKGAIKEYAHVEGGICFECNGNGRAKPTQAKKAIDSMFK